MPGGRVIGQGGVLSISRTYISGGGAARRCSVADPPYGEYWRDLHHNGAVSNAPLYWRNQYGSESIECAPGDSSESSTTMRPGRPVRYWRYSV